MCGKWQTRLKWTTIAQSGREAEHLSAFQQLFPPQARVELSLASFPSLLVSPYNPPSLFPVHVSHLASITKKMLYAPTVFGPLQTWIGPVLKQQLPDRMGANSSRQMRLKIKLKCPLIMGMCSIAEDKNLPSRFPASHHLFDFLQQS
jgi:hypothetical protein